jgi:sulfur carrier protein
VRVTINGDPRDLPDGATVLAAVSATGVEAGERGVAVAVDAAVVPRSAWAATVVAPGARIEILRASAGG